VVPLLRAEGGEEEPQVCLVATEDGRAAEVEAMYMLFIGTCRKTVWAGGGWGGRASKRGRRRSSLIIGEITMKESSWRRQIYSLIYKRLKKRPEGQTSVW